MSPALIALAEACYPDLDWLKAQKAAEALAVELKLPEVHLEVLFLDQYTPCRCACCGHKHSITKRRGVYLNGRLVHELIEEAHAEIYRQNRRLALGL